MASIFTDSSDISLTSREYSFVSCILLIRFCFFKFLQRDPACFGVNPFSAIRFLFSKLTVEHVEFTDSSWNLLHFSPWRTNTAKKKISHLQKIISPYADSLVESNCYCYCYCSSKLLFKKTCEKILIAKSYPEVFLQKL